MERKTSCFMSIKNDDEVASKLQRIKVGITTKYKACPKFQPDQSRLAYQLSILQFVYNFTVDHLLYFNL